MSFLSADSLERLRPNVPGRFPLGTDWTTATESQPKAKHIIDIDGGEEGDLGCAEAT